DAIRTAGWELRHAFVWRNDNLCVERAAFGAMSLAERIDGGIAPAVGSMARRDALAAGMLVAFEPRAFPKLHAAPVARTDRSELVVIDHLVSPADDGLLPAHEWLRRIGGDPEQATVLRPVDEPPPSLRGGPGIPLL